MRARVTRALVEKAGFDFVAVEADWPDAAEVDACVRRSPAERSRLWFDRGEAVTPVGEEHRGELEAMPETFPCGL